MNIKMNVKSAKDRIKPIEKICNEAHIHHSEDPKNADFYADTAIFLCEYQKILTNAINKAIDEAELSL